MMLSHVVMQHDDSIIQFHSCNMLLTKGTDHVGVTAWSFGNWDMPECCDLTGCSCM